MPRVSVIIPCYNQGAYLDEAVDSVLAQTFQDVEIIIVNDGSTDESTILKCEGYQGGKTTVISTTNQGLATARNNGISAARGDYILPLDADDKIGADYLEEAVAVLDNSSDIGIVYCRARLFGAVEADWLLPPYSIEEILKDNVIFCSALFRKSDWKLVGGYDSGMIYGWEDYDFWLSLIERGRTVKQLPGRYFYYRVSTDSMVRSTEKWQKVEMFKRIYQRHSTLIGDHIETWIDTLLEAQKKYLTSRLYVDCGRGVNDRDSVARKVEPGTNVIVFTIEKFNNRQALRFDPLDCPVCVEIHSIIFFDGQKEEAYDLNRLGSNALYRSGNYFRFDSADPQIFFDLDPRTIESLIRVIVKLEFTAIGDEALRNIIDFQKTSPVPERRWFSLPKWFLSPRS